MSKLIQAVMHEGVHSVTFEYKKIQYIISGYWVIAGYNDAFDPQAEEIAGTEHFYDNKDQLIHATIFEGKTLVEIAEDTKILEIYNDWD